MTLGLIYKPMPMALDPPRGPLRLVAVPSGLHRRHPQGSQFTLAFDVILLFEHASARRDAGRAAWDRRRRCVYTRRATGQRDEPDTLEQLLEGGRLSRVEEAAGGERVGAVEDELTVVGRRGSRRRTAGGR